LGLLPDYKTYFADPVERGAAADASLDDVEQMKRKAYVLHRALEPMVQYKGLIPGEACADIC